jgi:hypothetical protein
MPTYINSKRVSVHSEFWAALTKDSNSLALSQLWVCAINNTTLRNIALKIENELPLYEAGTWRTFGVLDTVLHNSNFTQAPQPGGVANDVYLWTQGASFIADGINTSRAGSEHVGAIKGLITDSRLDLNATNITFLESNVSFVDGILRPWSVLVGHRSLKDPDLRCDIELYCLQKWTLNEPLRARKSMVLRNAVPINIDAEEYNYSGDKLIQRQVQFAFDRYEMSIYPDTTIEVIDAKKMDEFVKPTLGTKVYYTPPGTQTDNDRSLLEVIEDALGAAANAVGAVQGVVADVTSSVAQGLNAFGLSEQADNVNDFNRRFQRDITAPVANVISTGQGAINATQNVGASLGKASGISKPVNADNIVSEINAGTPRAPITATGQSTTQRADVVAAQIVSDTKATVAQRATMADQGQDITLMEDADFV